MGEGNGRKGEKGMEGAKRGRKRCKAMEEEGRDVKRTMRE